MIPLAPPGIDPDEARRRMLEELSKAEYDDSPGFVQWLLETIESWLTEIVKGIDGSSAAQAGLFALLIALALGVTVLVLRRTGLIRRSATLTVETALDTPDVLSAAELRSAARDAVAAGRRDDAAVLAMRALVRDLEDRTLLDVTAGMTAHEAAEGASVPFPELRGRLQLGAQAFDTAAYSYRSVSAKQAEDLVRLTEYIAESSPDLTESPRAAG